MEMKTLTKAMLRESHQRQFDGEDYQAVAIAIAESNGFPFESDEYTELQSGPDPSCKCGFCKTAAWED